MAEKRISYADKPWLKSYKLGPYALPQTLTYPKVPVYEFLDNAASNYPDNVAILYFGRRLTYEELKFQADKLACALADLDIKKGDRVATILPNCPQAIISYFGILKAGAVQLPITPLLKGEELLYQLNRVGAETVICLDELLDVINSIKDRTSVRRIIITSRQDYTPEENPEIDEVPGTCNLRSLIEEYEPSPPEIEIDPTEDLAVLYGTGGATGVPKPVMHTHCTLAAIIVAGLPWMLGPLETGARGKASILISTPLYHGAAHLFSFMAIYWGFRVILLPDPRDTDAIIKTIKEYRPFIVFAVPTQLMRLVQKKVGRIQSLVVTGTSTLPKEIAEAWKKETGMPVTQAYGLSEGMGTMNVSGFSKLTGFMPVEKHSLGIPMPDTEAKVIDPETGEEVSPGEVGEIHLRGPHIMKGYWPTPGSGLIDGWLPTGDLGYMDEDGYFYIVDRIKDMINVSGLKVYSTEVDEVLFKHPAVAVAVAVGIPDPERPGSERVKAFIKLREGYEGKVSAEDIIAYSRDNLPPYAAPKFVEFRDDMPLTATEKLFKKALRDEEIARMESKGEIG